MNNPKPLTPSNYCVRVFRASWQLILFIAIVTTPGGCTTSSGPVPQSAGTFLSSEDAQFLDGLTRAVIDAARVPTGSAIPGHEPNTSGYTLIRPSASEAHPAFWVRDFAMSLDSGLITLDEQRHAIMHTASFQQDGSLLLPITGARVPPGAIPDHITFDGVPIFFPGTFDNYTGQGGGPWGNYPCFDNPFYFIHMVYTFVDSSKDVTVLQAKVRDKSILKRLQLAYSMPPHHAETGLVTCTEEMRGANFGFMDTVHQTGDLLISSLLKLRAAMQLATLMDTTGNAIAADLYREDAAHIRNAIATTFPLESGFLRASTGRSAQPDVWGTALAVYLGMLPPELELRASTALANAYKNDTIAWRGLIRHVPTDADFNSETIWETTGSEKNRDQNGAYWATPTGWVTYAIAHVDQGLARKLASEYVATLRDGDFRKGKRQGEPWACAHPKGNYQQHAAYLTSVTAPLAAFRRINTER